MRCEPARRRMAKSSIAAVETMSSRPAATSISGWRIFPGYAGSAKSAIVEKAALTQPTVGAAEAERRRRLEHRLGARIAHRVRGQRVADDTARADSAMASPPGTYDEPIPAKRISLRGES